jgi:hypothetical protein
VFDAPAEAARETSSGREAAHGARVPLRSRCGLGAAGRAQPVAPHLLRMTTEIMEWIPTQN